MTARELFEAVGYVDDELIGQADTPAVRRRGPAVWQSAAAMAACLCLAVGVAQASGLDLLGSALDLVMPRAGSSSPSSAAAYCTDPAEEAGVPETASMGGAAESAADEGQRKQDTTAEQDGVCPLNTADYPLWAAYDPSGWEDQPLTLPAGMLLVLTDEDGRPFAAGASLTIQADGAFTAACAPEGGTPVPMAQQAGPEVTVTLPEDGGEQYFCVLAGEEDITLLAAYAGLP